MGRRLELAKNLPFMNWKLTYALLFSMDGHYAKEFTFAGVSELGDMGIRSDILEIILREFDLKAIETSP